MLELKSFFSLERFAHRSLWNEEGFVGSALANVRQYLNGWPHRIESEIPEGVFLENAEAISIGKNVLLSPGVMISGPCIIGDGCEIRHGAYLRGGVILGDKCIVGHAAEIKHSILLDGACATHFVYVGDSILGNGVNLGAGVKCANLRLDRKEVVIFHEGTKIRTGLKKFGALIGDETQIGCNCVLNPGTLIGKGSVVYPLLNFGGTIPPYSQVKGSSAHSAEPIPEKILERLLK